MLVRSSFCFQLVLGLLPPPSIRTFKLYGPGTVFAVYRCHLGCTGTCYFYFSNILFYFIFLFQTQQPCNAVGGTGSIKRMIDFSEVTDRFATLKTRRVLL